MVVGLTLKDKLKYCWQREKRKYKWLGYYKYVSFFMFVCMFMVVPEMLKLIWPYVQNQLSTISLYFWSTVLFNLGFITIYHIVMYVVYTIKHPFFEQYRCEKNLIWPWDDKQKNWKELFWTTLRVDLTNSVAVAGALTYIDSLIRLDVLVKVEDAPSTFTMVWQITYFLIVEEILFYTFHRLLHHQKLYRFHKTHHEYKNTVCLSFVYSSPLEHILNLIASGLAYKNISRFYPVHIFTVIIWIMYRVLEGMDGHSGYDFPWHVTHLIPFSAGGRYHSFHHSRNVGNFGGVLHIFDTLFGTNVEWRNLQALEIRKEEKVQ